MGARKCSRHYMAKHGAESLYQDQTSVKQVVALPNLSLLALALPFGTGRTLPRGVWPHDVACREWAQPPRAEHTLTRSKSQPCCGCGKVNSPAPIMSNPTASLPNQQMLLPTVILQQWLLGTMFADGSRLPWLPLAVILSVKVLKTDLLIQ